MSDENRTSDRRGDKNSMVRLTSLQVEEIKRRRKNYRAERKPENSLKALAEEFGVTESWISKIARGAGWAHLEPAMQEAS